MTTLDPTIATLDRPDQLGGALQQVLPRPMNPKLTWSVIRTFILAAISGGILPLVLLGRRLNDFEKAEQFQIWHLAEWLRVQTGDAQAAVASAAAHRVMPGMALRFMSLAFVMLAIGIGITGLRQDRRWLQAWFDLTLPNLRAGERARQLELRVRERAERYPAFGGASRDEWGHRSSDYFYSPPSSGPQAQWHEFYSSGNVPASSTAPPDRIDLNAFSPVAAPDLVHAFALAITGASLCWLIELNAHIGRVRRFVLAFNQLSGNYGVGPVRAPGWHLGLRPLWLLAGLTLCWAGGFWGMPLMLAAGAHRRYIKSTSQRLRQDLARRHRDVLLAVRPPLRVPTSTHLMNLCPRENCRTPYPPEAVYCRRCGTRLRGVA
jgi:hypothetical protein